MPGRFGIDGFGSSPYGGGILSYQVVGGAAQNPYSVVVGFNLVIDVSFPAFLAPSNYSVPGLTVSAAAFESPTSVRLFTTAQSYSLYTVTVAQARSAAGVYLDPLHKTATFTGIGGAPGYISVGTARRRVRLVFSEAMRQNSDLTHITNYTVTDIHGHALTILSVTPEQSSNVLSVILTLASDMRTTEWYVTSVNALVVTESGGLSVLPGTQKFQWVEDTGQFSLALDRFSGEVQGGLFGTPAGLVFFSPALNVPAANSSIQVDEVSVCTTAYDTYVMPQPIDPAALYTYGGPIPPPTLLGGTVLWAPFPRLVEARFELTFTGPSMVEFMPEAVDGPCTATFREPWDHNYVALLNNPAWMLYDNSAPTTPPIFICAANMAPIPPGPMSTIVLEEAPYRAIIVADSSLMGTMTRNHGVTEPIVADSQMLASLSMNWAATMSTIADSLAAGSASKDYAVSASLVADSVVQGGGLLGGIAAYWPLDGAGNDASGHGYDLSQDTQTPLWVAGKFGQSLHVPGHTGGYRQHRLVDDAAFNLVGDFAISMWLNFNDLGGENDIISKLNSSSGPGWTLIFSATSIWFYDPTGLADSSVSYTTTLSTWHHFVMRRTGTTLNMIVDGTTILTRVVPNAGSPGGPSLSLGSRTDGFGNIDGIIDDVGFWNRTLTDAEVAWLWNGGTGHRVNDPTPLTLTKVP